jgi:hypothetical protein
MHASEPDDQLRRESVDAPCRRCHAAEARRATEHTHHPEGSAGSSCVGCHMPFTSYALFTAIRSHRIDSPSALATAENGRPNACNLCHLDRSLAWTARTQRTWYGAEAPASPGSAATAQLQDETPRSLVELLAGDAATRVVLAAAFGRAEARAATHGSWQARALAELLDDPYAAVRKVACAALHATPDFSGISCNFTAAPAARRAARDAALARFVQIYGERERRFGNDDPLSFDARVDALLRRRDQRATTISE